MRKDDGETNISYNISCNFLEWSDILLVIVWFKIGYTIPYEEGWWCQYHHKVGLFRTDALVRLVKSKQYYNLLIQLKATLPNPAKKPKHKFNLEYEDLSEVTLSQLKFA